MLSRNQWEKLNVHGMKNYEDVYREEEFRVDREIGEYFGARVKDFISEVRFRLDDDFLKIIESYLDKRLEASYQEYCQGNHNEDGIPRERKNYPHLSREDYFKGMKQSRWYIYMKESLSRFSGRMQQKNLGLASFSILSKKEVKENLWANLYFSDLDEGDLLILFQQPQALLAFWKKGWEDERGYLHWKSTPQNERDLSTDELYGTDRLHSIHGFYIEWRRVYREYVDAFWKSMRDGKLEDKYSLDIVRLSQPGYHVEGFFYAVKAVDKRR